jgi:hypothetical protein
LRVAAVFAAIAILVVAGEARALNFSENPQRSFLVGIDLGAGLDLDPSSRSPRDPLAGGNPEAYSTGGFLIGVDIGGRFDEVFGLEAGWHHQNHDAAGEWGTAYYGIGHVALRLAIPTPTRQTPVFVIGPALGPFYYGSADYGLEQDNGTLALGGMAGIKLEHELTFGVLAFLRVAYLPLWRFGMDHVIQLDVYSPQSAVPDASYRKDFTQGGMVHLLWISAGIQFEWTFR